MSFEDFKKEKGQNLTGFWFKNTIDLEIFRKNSYI